MLFGFILSKTTFGYSSVLGSIILAICSFGFGKLGYRLLLNKPRKNGGLLSNNGLKLGCILFGESSILCVGISIMQHEFSLFITALGMLTACLYGWQMAKKRQINENITLKKNRLGR